MPLNIKDLKIASTDFEPLGWLRDEHAGDKATCCPNSRSAGFRPGRWSSP